MSPPSPRRAAGPLLITGVLVVTVVVVLSIVAGVPVQVLIEDPAFLLGGHPLTGMLSNLGVLLWAATAAVCGFTYWSSASLQLPPLLRAYVGLGGAITTALLLDDLFMLHEEVLPLTFGIDQKIVAGAYALGLPAYFWYFRSLLSRRHVLLGASLLLLAFSLGYDQFMPPGGEWRPVWEDGPKFLGIVAWFGHFTLMSRQVLEAGFHAMPVAGVRGTEAAAVGVPAESVFPDGAGEAAGGSVGPPSMGTPSSWAAKARGASVRRTPSRGPRQPG